MSNAINSKETELVSNLRTKYYNQKEEDLPNAEDREPLVQAELLGRNTGNGSEIDSIQDAHV